MGKKRIHNRPKIPQIQAVYCLTGAFEAPIYRAHAARWPLVLRAVFRLWQNEGSPLAGLFDIVIRGRGTWAAARSQLKRKLGRNQSSYPNARVLQAIDMKLIVSDLSWVGARSTPSCQIANNDVSFVIVQDHNMRV